MGRIFALLVGINDYPEGSGLDKLQGCLNDIDNAQDYLTASFADPAIVTLKDHDATRANVIEQFRKHLGQAGQGDVALFQYCGHGARSKAAPEFHSLDLDNRDEGIVCVDSRNPDMFDLADKELALLLQELAPNDAHVAMILDCCHSGSGSRDTETPESGVRSAPPYFPPRPLETYLEGQFAGMFKSGASLSVPVGRHILMAACDRSQTAKEDLEDHRGIFTTALYDVLRRSGAGITYADLFVRSRARVRQYIRDKGKSSQEPQFETAAGFDAYAGFLGQAVSPARRSYAVGYDGAAWKLECGAIEGLPADPATPVILSVHPEGAQDTLSGTARTTRVGAQTSDVALDFAADVTARYSAEITSIPQAPIFVAFQGSAEARAAVEAALAGSPGINIALAEAGTDDGFVLAEEAGTLRLVERGSGRLVKSVAMAGAAEAWFAPMGEALAHVAKWRRSLGLSNPRPQLDPERVDFVFAETLDDGSESIHRGPEITFLRDPAKSARAVVAGKLKLRNRTGQLLNFVLVHFSEDFGVRVITNEQLVAGPDFMTILVPGEKPSEVKFWLAEGRQQSLDRLKVILSTERVDDFLIDLDPITDSREFGSAADFADQVKPITDDWFTRDLSVRITRSPAQATRE